MDVFLATDVTIFKQQVRLTYMKVSYITDSVKLKRKTGIFVYVDNLRVEQVK